jgi:hypothetical protein
MGQEHLCIRYQTRSMSFDADTADLVSRLAEAHKFSLTTLETNRAGLLTPEQARGLRRQAVGSLLFGLLCIAAVLFSVLVYWLAAGMQSFLLLILFGGLFGMAVVGALIKYIRTLNDANTNRVAVVEGVVTRRFEGDSITTYYYVIDNQTFQVSAQGHKALREGLTYRLYYAPSRKVLPGIEPVSTPGDMSK